MKHCVKFLVALVALLFCASGYAAGNVCSWDKPGANPYRGSVPDAVDKYTDIPKAVRDRLKARMDKRQYDDVAVIRRDDISGKGSDYTNLRDMHFGSGQVCQSVTRTQWLPQSEERGLVYCESGHCIIVPTVCRNVSRVDRKDRELATEPPGTAQGAGAAPAPVVVASPPAVAQEAPAEESRAFALGGGGGSSFSEGSGNAGAGGGFVIGPVNGGGGGGGIYIPGPNLPTPPPVVGPGKPVTPPPVPEPATWALMLAGVVFLTWRKITG